MKEKEKAKNTKYINYLICIQTYNIPNIEYHTTLLCIKHIAKLQHLAITLIHTSLMHQKHYIANKPLLASSNICKNRTYLYRRK